MTARCPYCGQRMLTREGVQLSVMLADLYDAIARHAGGLHSDVLAHMFHPGISTQVAKLRIRANIHLLNDRLEQTDVRVRGEHCGRHSGFYRIVRRGA